VFESSNPAGDSSNTHNSVGAGSLAPVSFEKFGMLLTENGESINKSRIQWTWTLATH